MFLKTAIRRGLVGALLLVGLSAIQACTNEDVMGPYNNDHEEGNCYWINGVRICD